MTITLELLADYQGNADALMLHTLLKLSHAVRDEIDPAPIVFNRLRRLPFAPPAKSLFHSPLVLSPDNLAVAVPLPSPAPFTVRSAPEA